MTLGLAVVLAMLAGAFGAHFLLADRGYVLISLQGYTLETSVPVLLLLIAALYFSVRAAIWVWQAPRRLGQAAGELRVRRANRQLTRGLIALAEGDWQRGERMLGRSATASDRPLLHYLSAARAADRQGAPERRDAWLARACEVTPEAAAAVLLTQAELQLARGELEDAQQTLARVEQLHAGHPQALLLQAQLHEARGSWSELTALLPRLRRARLLPAGEFEALTVRAVGHALASPALENAALEAIWRELPRALRQHPQLCAGRARALKRLERLTQCEQELRALLSAGVWHGELVRLYGELETPDEPKHLRRIERWLESRPDDPELLLAAGRVAMRAESWGKAQSYLETSLDLRATAEVYQVYGRLMTRLGHSEAASEAYRSGLSLVTDSRIVLPALNAPPAPREEARH